MQPPERILNMFSGPFLFCWTKAQWGGGEGGTDVVGVTKMCVYFSLVYLPGIEDLWLAFDVRLKGG